ncbi:TonB-dependent receptor [Sphingomonas sp. ID0503]|uniref:TonB-dependent receptor n=1 Tax=Sphingomonas sp. ID0503 TaxID=3399691 RepID=UPI003AFA9B1D
MRHLLLAGTMTALLPMGAVAADAPAGDAGEIIVTAQGRDEAAKEVPIAVTVVGAEAMRRTGATDIRQLNQLVPSLLVSSSSTEAAGAAARIRGIGTVGDNVGLESSVATYVDGVYRPRAGVALTELGPIERVEVLRGPQGTFFGRNASAGAIAITTALPSFTEEGRAEASVGNYDYRRFQLGLTGPVNDVLAYRLDGVWTKRDGFLKDVVADRRINDRDRWLARGQLLYRPSDDLSVRIIADYAKRDEECCAGVYLPMANRSLGPNGSIVTGPSTLETLYRDLGATIADDPFSRRTALTPGQTNRQDVRDAGISADVDWTLGAVTIRSITAYRDWKYTRGQDGDFGPLDILVRADDGSAGSRFRTFSQELRANGTLFSGKLDWLVGGYYSNEKLKTRDNFQYGADYGRFYACYLAASLGRQIGNAGCLSDAARANLANPAGSFGAAGATLLGAFDRLASIPGGDGGVDTYRQDTRNWALFTHNVFRVTDRLSLTGGLRYTHERKRLAGDLNGSATGSAACLGNLAARDAILADPTSPAAARSLAGSLGGLSCILTPIVSADIADRQSDEQFTGTAALSYRLTEALTAYAIWSRGYKSGGYNLDRAPLSAAAPDARLLRFKPEKVEAFEVGAKFASTFIDVNAAAFLQRVRNFQLNAFTGASFAVENIAGCSDLSGGAGTDSDNIAGNGACAGKSKPGVISKGVEVEMAIRPRVDVVLNLGGTYADTRYADDLTGAEGRPLGTGFFQLPGRRVSNAPAWVLTGGAGWTPDLGHGLTGLFYGDVRYQSRINTGSDLDLEKVQGGVAVVNARIGISHPAQGWSVELWAQNLLDADYIQVGYDAPGQPGGAFNTARGVLSGYQAVATQLHGVLLAEPRTWGLTVKTVF